MEEDPPGTGCSTSVQTTRRCVGMRSLVANRSPLRMLAASAAKSAILLAGWSSVGMRRGKTISLSIESGVKIRIPPCARCRAHRTSASRGFSPPNARGRELLQPSDSCVLGPLAAVKHLGLHLDAVNHSSIWASRAIASFGSVRGHILLIGPPLEHGAREPADASPRTRSRKRSSDIRIVDCEFTYPHITWGLR